MGIDKILEYGIMDIRSIQKGGGRHAYRARTALGGRAGIRGCSRANQIDLR